MEIGYLLRDRDYSYADEPLVSIFENTASQQGVNVKYVVIKSNLARIHCISTREINYIIWDMRFWEVFKNHFVAAMNIDMVTEDKEKLSQNLHCMTLNMLQYLGDRYRYSHKNISKIFYRQCWTSGWDNNFCDYENDYMDICIYICKLYCSFHEQFHLLYSNNQIMKQRTEKCIIAALQNLKEKIFADLKEFSSSADYYDADEFSRIVNDILNKKEPINEELLVDAAAFYQTFVVACLTRWDNKEQWLRMVPLVRNSIEFFRSFSLIVKTLVKVTDECIRNSDSSQDTAISLNISHAKEIVMREKLLTYIDIQQLFDILNNFNKEQVYEMFIQQGVRPYRHNFYKYIQPHCQGIARNFIMPIFV